MTNTRIINFGCRLNAYEAGLLEKKLQDLGVADVVVFNTCAVTQESVRQCKQSVRREKRLHSRKKLVVTGCASQLHREAFENMPEVDGVVDNMMKLESDAWRKVLNLPSPPPRPATQDPAASFVPPPIQQTREHTARPRRARGLVGIQNGCDHSCTFCVIPHGRGPSHSRHPDHIVEDIRRLLDEDCQEVVLTGVDLTSYKSGGTECLGHLVEHILKQIQELPRLRLSSLDVAEIDSVLFKALCTRGRLMPHVHLSLQSGDNMILKRMKRRHTREQAFELCNALRRERPEITFGADIIVGFPTETNDMFDNTVDLVTACDLTWLHVFPFSPRQGTPAARMPQVDARAIKSRAAKMRDVAQKQKERYFSRQNGRVVSLVMETENLGRSEEFAPVIVASPRRRMKPGCLVTARVTGWDVEHLLAEQLG